MFIYEEQLKNGTTTRGTKIFELPIGYRPPKDIIAAARTYDDPIDSFGSLLVEADGEVKILRAVADFSVDGISFYAGL